MNKFIWVIMSFTLLLFTGCTNNTSANTDDNVITVWAWDMNFNIPIMQEAANRYMSKNENVQINIVDFAQDDLMTALTVGLQSGNINALPDITLIEDQQVQRFLQIYEGMFLDFSDIIEANYFAPYKIEALSFNNRLYGVPFDAGVTGLFYRSDLLENAGLTHSDLEYITWREFFEIGKQVIDANEGISLVADNRNEPAGIIRMAMHSAGTWYFDGDGINLSNNSAAIEVLDNLLYLHESGMWLQTVGWNEWVSAGNRGDVFAYISGAWLMPSIMQAEEQSGNWRIAPMPRLDNAESVNASNIGGSSWVVIDKQNDNTAAAVNFLMNTFASDVDFYQHILLEYGAIATFLPALDGEAYQQKSEFFGGQQVYRDFARWMVEVPRVDFGLHTSTVDQMIHNNAPAFFNGQISSQELLEAAETQIRSQIR